MQNNLTDFQWSVLTAIQKIPFGETRSYQWVAGKIGKPKAARAVGQALNKIRMPQQFHVIALFAQMDL